MALYKRGGIWWLYVTIEGRRIRRSTGQTSKAEASKAEAEFKSRAKLEKESGKTLNDAIKLWLTTAKRTDKEKSALRIFLKLYPNRPLSEVLGHDILDALSIKSASNTNRIVNSVRAAVNLAHKRDWCAEIKITRKKVVTSRLRFLSEKEWKRLEAELPSHLKAMAQFAISTGLRQSNVLGLKWQNIDLNRGVAWVDASESKSDKSISVPLSAYAQDVLRTQIGQHDVFVFTYNKKPVHSVKTAWAKALKRAKVLDFRWHDLRHTWASWHVMNGTPLAVLKELGGWHDISMVMRYSHLSPEHLVQYAGNASVA